MYSTTSFAVSRRTSPADGRIGTADSGEDKLQEVVDFGRGRDSRAGILDVDLLLDGDGRGNPLDGFDIGFGHAAEELARIGGKAFGETPLPLGKEGVEGEGGLAAAGYAGNDDEFPARNLQRDVLEVVDLGPPDDDAPFLWHARSDLDYKDTLFLAMGQMRHFDNYS